MTPPATKNVDLVLEGGGVKGIGLIGAVVVLYNAGYRFPRVAGTSAGAIVAALIAAFQKDGRDLNGLEDVMNSLVYKNFEDGPEWQKITDKLGDAFELLLHEGMHTGDYLTTWLGPLLHDCGVDTFKDLALADPGGTLKPYQAYSLVVHTSDLSRKVLVRLPWDYPQYKKVADTERVVDAVRASMSIPFFFKPVTVTTDTGSCTWVDGGLLSNFPITVFDRTDATKSRWPTWGIKLSAAPQPGQDKPVTSAAEMAVHCVKTATTEWNRYDLADQGVNQRTMYVDTFGTTATDFSLSVDDRNRLFANGQDAAKKFLALQPKD